MPNGVCRNSSFACSSLTDSSFGIRHSKLTLTPLAIRMREDMRRHALLRDGTRVLVGLSGGADSVALLLILRELERDGVLTVAGAAHLNHQLRGEEADGDEAFCAALAARLNVPFRAERLDVAALRRARNRSIAPAARPERGRRAMSSSSAPPTGWPPP